MENILVCIRNTFFHISVLQCMDMSSFTYAFKRQWAFGLFLFGATRKIPLGILAPKVWCVDVFISPGFTLGEALLSHSIGRNLACSSWRLSQRCTVYIPIISAGGSQVHVLSTTRYSQLLLWDITLESESKICSESLEYRSLQCIDFRKTGIPALCWKLFHGHAMRLYLYLHSIFLCLLMHPFLP